MARWTQADVDAAQRSKAKQARKPLPKVHVVSSVLDDPALAERQTQAQIVDVLDDLGLVYFHINNGANIGAVAGAIAQGQGVKAGVPDLFVSESFEFGGVIYHGLYIEVKKPRGGKVSDKQQLWRDALRERNYWVLSGLGGAGLVIDFLCEVYKPRIAPKCMRAE